MNLKTLRERFPCKCGHIKKSHLRVDAPIWEEWCTGNQEGTTRSKLCDCDEYIPDNLGYLEKMAQKRGKINAETR